MVLVAPPVRHMCSVGRSRNSRVQTLLSGHVASMRRGTLAAAAVAAPVVAAPKQSACALTAEQYVLDAAPSPASTEYVRRDPVKEGLWLPWETRLLKSEKLSEPERFELLVTLLAARNEVSAARRERLCISKVTSQVCPRLLGPCCYRILHMLTAPSHEHLATPGRASTACAYGDLRPGRHPNQKAARCRMRSGGRTRLSSHSLRTRTPTRTSSATETLWRSRSASA